MEQEFGFSSLIDDLKISIRFAIKNFISFLLGMIGVLIVTALLVGVFMAISLSILTLVLGDFHNLMEFFMDIGSLFATGNVLSSAGVLFTVISLFMMPLAAAFFVAIGALFGMSREIVESDGTTVSGIFVWYRTKFLSLAAGGVLLHITVMIPILVMWYIAIVITQTVTLTGAFVGVLTSMSFIWFVISGGMLSMMFPAIIDGAPVLQAYKQSVRLSLTYFDRVFATWLSFVVMLFLLGSPLNLGMPAMAYYLGPLGAVVSIIIFVFAIILLPALSIALTRLYMMLTAEGEFEDSDISHEEHSDLQLVGGV